MKYAIPAHAARRLRKVAALILEEPKRVSMYKWLWRQTKPGEVFKDEPVRMLDRDEGMEMRDRKRSEMPPCGTVGCIAGWTLLTTAKYRKNAEARADIGEIAARVLDLDSSQRGSLFHPQRWPIPFQERLKKYRPGTVRYAQVVADRIEYFIETGD